jgi:CO/xanthine dehydrogenase Mo-binding subunit
MGQHVGTALARILADELEIAWDNVRIKQVDSDPKWGLMVTGGSWSVWQTLPIYSQAGAAGRTALIEAGAAALGVDAATCTARSGEVISGSKKISYADIVKKGVSKTFTPEELAALPVKLAAERRLIGKPVMARDIMEKTNGTALYGIDAKVDGMVYARPIMPPTRNRSKVNSVDDSAAKSVKGYQQSLVIDDPSGTVTGWVMVIADTYLAAIEAADLVKVDWTPGPTSKVSEKQIQDHAGSLLDDPSQGAILDTGLTDTTAAFAAATTKVEATYTTGTALHMHLEPVNALALEKDGVMKIDTGNQWQSLLLPWLATALGMPEDKIVMRAYRLGGGFGRRLNGDYAVPAALAAKALGKPVKMVLTREDDTRMDSVRSPSVQRLRLAADTDGKVTGMEQHVAAGWPTQVMAPFFMPNGVNGVTYNPFAVSGADHWHTVGAHRVRAVSNDLANSTFRPGWLPSVGFRLTLLDGAGMNADSTPNAVGGALRQAEVVRRCAANAGWGKILPADTGIGLATSFGQERGMPTWVACTAQVRVDRASGRVTVEKLTLVTDASTIVDTDSALAQMEGAALWGLSLALHEGTEFVNGQVRDLNLGPYTPLRLADVPELDISFVESTEVPVGLGEPATTVVGPAIGNAIFNAVGARLRHIPITSEAVLAAI